MEDLLRGLVDRLKAAYDEEELLSVVLYGSAASGDYHEKHSDLNVLCVLRQIGLRELERAEEPLRWWLKRGQPAPLLMSAEEVLGGADVFPIEFLDIKENYRLLHGADLVATLLVDTAKHRLQLEHELRSRLLRLRKKFLETQHDEKAVVKLMLDSLPSFATLFRHALLRGGFPAPTKKQEIFRAAAERFQVGPHPFAALLEVRQGTRRPPAGEVRAWFGAYLEGVTKMCEIEDRE
ncbi:MAG: nucleotidyltransferase domain-containing protein [Acidobacteria bacterium]|nr:nucleotidyltransferase domain-containing protein [Acidobacteriota bacterium]